MAANRAASDLGEATARAMIDRGGHQLIRVVDPQTAEEERLRARIDALRAEVSAMAAELAELRATLAAFEARYDARIGVLIVELDRVELEIARVRRKLAAIERERDDAAWRDAESAIERELRAEQERIEAEAAEAGGARERADELPPEPSVDVKATIKDRYRRLARAFHPDLAVDEDERAFNERAMRRINAAMERNDLDALEILAIELPARTESIPGPTPGARIAWSVSEIARLENVLARTTGELAAVRATSTWAMWDRAARDSTLLDRLEADLARDLTAARMEQHALDAQYRDLLARRAVPEGVPE